MTDQTISLGGLITFWSIGQWTSLAKLTEGLKAEGFDRHMPQPRTPQACLKEALSELYPNVDELIRPLDKKDGFAVVREIRGAVANEYVHVCTATINERSQIGLTPFATDQARTLAEKYNRQLGMIRPQAVADVLTSILKMLGGTMLRPGGSIYWLPDNHLPTWKQVSRIIEGASISGASVYMVQHSFDAEAVRAVRDAITAEVFKQAKIIDDDIASGVLGERALRLRQQQAEELTAKVQEYEQMLDVGLGNLRATLEKTQNSTVAAIMLASGISGAA